jgi:inner membrane protein
MASASAHFIVGAALALPAIKSRQLTALMPGWVLPVSSGLLATIPDLDLIARRLFGIRSPSFFSHRGVSHSPFLLVLLAAVLALIVARHSSRPTFAYLWLLWAGCMVTHPLLDALTDGGRGVMLLIPFARTRLYFPWRPIHTPVGHVRFLARAFLIGSSEIPFCAAAIVVGVSGLLLRKRARSEDSLKSEKWRLEQIPGKDRQGEAGREPHQQR